MLVFSMKSGLINDSLLILIFMSSHKAEYGLATFSMQHPVYDFQATYLVLDN